MSTASVSSTEIQALISEDRSQAFLRIPKMNMTPFEQARLEMICLSAGIDMSDAVSARLAELIKLCTSGQTPQEDFLIAEASTSDAQDACFEFAPELDPRNQSEDADAFTRFHLRPIESGTNLGKLAPAKAGEPGKDVTGEAIPAPTPKDITLDESVKMADDGCTVVADKPGIVDFDRRRLAVLPIQRISGDVGSETGNITTEDDLDISRGVQDNYLVESTRSITIGDSIRSAVVTATGDVVVRMGIIGQGKGKVIAGGRIVCQYGGAANLQADGDIHIDKELVNSTVHTQGRLIMPNGSILGGRIHAHRGGEVRALGKNSKDKTVISLGIDPQVFARNVGIGDQIAKKTQALKRAQELLAPMQANMKRLSPQQKEQAMEMVLKMGAAQNGIDALIKQREQALKDAAPPEPAVLHVHAAIHAGTTIVFGDLATEFFHDFDGPIRIELRDKTILATNARTGSTKNLPVIKYAEPLNDE